MEGFYLILSVAVSATIGAAIAYAVIFARKLMARLAEVEAGIAIIKGILARGKTVDMEALRKICTEIISRQLN